MGYRTVYEGGTGEITEKKSRFIATVRPVSSEEEAASFISEIKKQYWDARHNCSAFVLGERQEITRCSDDGEPAQTAGRPMLEVLLKEGLTNVAVVVTRYFGGVLLGTGGLVRAYQKAVQEGLAQSRIIEKLSGRLLCVDTDYNEIGRLQYLFGQQEIPVLDTEYASGVRWRVLVPLSRREELEKKIIEQTNGKAALEWKEEVFYAVCGKETMIFS